jgi:hypothetical protein
MHSSLLHMLVRQLTNFVSVQIRAAALGHVECVSLLRHHNPEVASYYNEARYETGPLAGHTALSVAAKNGHHVVVHELLSENPVADVHSGPYHGAAFLEAAACGHGLVLDVLLSHGCDPNCHLNTGRMSAMQRSIDAEQWLICAVCLCGDYRVILFLNSIRSVRANSYHLLFLTLDY